MKLILSALAAVTLLAGVAAAQPAEARCFWNGFAMECYHPYPWWHHHYYHHYYGPWDWRY